MSFEILDLSRLLFLKRLEQGDDEPADGKGKETAEGDSLAVKHVKERLADTHDLLAELSLENERYRSKPSLCVSFRARAHTAAGTPTPLSTSARRSATKQNCTPRNPRSLPRRTSSCRWLWSLRRSRQRRGTATRMPPSSNSTRRSATRRPRSWRRPLRAQSSSCRTKRSTSPPCTRPRTTRSRGSKSPRSRRSSPTWKNG